MVRNGFFLAALALVCASASASGQGFRELLPQVIEKARVQEFSVRFEETANASQTVALSARYQAGNCLITALTGSAFVEDVLAEQDPDDRSAVLEAFLAHELAHCEDRRRDQTRRSTPDALSASVPRVVAWRDASGVLRLAPLPHAELWSETFADAYMGVYLQRWHPARAQRVMTVLLERRMRFADIDPGHNSARFLTADSLHADPSESLYSAAARIRAQGFARASRR